VAVAATTRLWNLGAPHILIFDEHFYVKDAYSLLRLGYEGRWAKLSDPDFAVGNFHGLTTHAELVQHPPLGKWIIALGLNAFGAGNSAGWRISMAIFGILAVVLLMGVAFLLFRSFALATIAGGLLAIDGNAIVMSRIGILDNAVMFLALVAFGAILLDRQWWQARVGTLLERTHETSDVGSGPRIPTSWRRPWLLVAGLAIGLDAGVKWSGFFFLAAFVVYVIGVDVLARRRAGVANWFGGTLVRQGLVDVVLMVPTGIAAYLATWTGWFVTSGGLYRNWANQPGHALTGAFAWIPRTVQSFWHFQQYIYEFGVSLNKAQQYETPASGWFLLTRPTQFFIGFTADGQPGCTSPGNCASVVTDLANPLIWWMSGLCVLLLVYRFIFRRDWRIAAILIGIVGGYVPWLVIPREAVFQFYTIAFEPYMILALVYAIWLLTGTPPHERSAGGAAAKVYPLALTLHRSLVGWRITIVFLCLCVLVSIFFLPVWIDLPEPIWLEQLHAWFPGWN
jgi:dolichyl-phosphate-mannose--protein O-mannosyl transferase